MPGEYVLFVLLFLDSFALIFCGLTGLSQLPEAGNINRFNTKNDFQVQHDIINTELIVHIASDNRPKQ